ncbi:MAG TPA: hypothetical protein VJ945_08490, partial [Flavobacteriaceae bacterium]|nr:hypothetical protein [Flavobacteriaceae bacterium]
KKDSLETLFENLKNDFDVESPNTGHELRFLSKLKGEETKVFQLKRSKQSFWKPLMAVAASIILCLSIFAIIERQPEAKDLASVSPELSETQKFFTTAINHELASLNSERTPETDKIINDALARIYLLEKEYKKLKVDLAESGDDQRVIYAMISNFQNRIELLQDVLKQIEEVKQLNQDNNENNTTI